MEDKSKNCHFFFKYLQFFKFFLQIMQLYYVNFLLKLVYIE